jgi:hypothetical protein
MKEGTPMKYYVVFDSSNSIYAFTPSLRGAQDTAHDVNGYYREATEEDLEED